MKINYNEFGLFIEKQIFNLLKFYQLNGFREKLESIIESHIKEIKDDSIILDNLSEIKSFDKLDIEPTKKIGYNEDGLHIGKLLFYFSRFTKSVILKTEICNLIEKSIKNIEKDKNGHLKIILNNNIVIESEFKTLYDMIKDTLCFKTLAYCCGVEKECPSRIRVMKACGISNDEYINLKNRFELIFKKSIKQKHPEYF